MIAPSGSIHIKDGELKASHLMIEVVESDLIIHPQKDVEAYLTRMNRRFSRVDESGDTGDRGKRADGATFVVSMRLTGAEKGELEAHTSVPCVMRVQSPLR